MIFPKELGYGIFLFWLIIYGLPTIMGFIIALILSLHFTAKKRKFYMEESEDRFLAVFLFSLISGVIFFILAMSFFSLLHNGFVIYVYWIIGFFIVFIPILEFISKKRKYYYIESKADRILVATYISFIFAGIVLIMASIIF